NIVAISFALIVGTLLGAINGLLVAYAKLPSFLVTLGTMALYRGVAQAMLGANGADVAPGMKGLDRAALPYPLIIFLACALVVGLLLHRMILGRWLFGIGTNKEAAHYTGFPVQRATVTTFALTGFLIGIAALMLNSRLGVARYDMEPGIELKAITIVVAGGTAISGGKGSMLGTVLSWLLLYFVRTGMGVTNIKAEYQLTIIGLILILSVFAQQIAANFSSNRLTKQTKLVN
ncbi:MAG: ABC transporter permease, partial [Armatimonadota bacterium]